MGKSKSSKVAATPVKAAAAVLNSVKGGRVTKPSQSEKAKAHEIAKAAASKKDFKKKAATPSDSEEGSESEADSEDSSSSEESDDASSASESESQTKRVPAAKANGVKGLNGLNGTNHASSEDESDGDSSSEESSSDSDQEGEATPAKANGINGKAAADDESESSDSDSDSESSDDGIVDAGKFQPDSDASDESDADSEDEPAKPTHAAETNGASNVDEDDSEDSEGSSDSGDEEEDAAAAAEPEQKKRKADDYDSPVAKKTKVADASIPEGASANLFVGRMSWNTDEDALHEEFKEFGEIVSCKVMYHEDSGKSKGFGFVEFANIADAVAAQAAKHESVVDGRNINVDFTTPKQPRKEGFQKSQDRASKYGDVESPPTDTIFVGNISFDATYEMIQETFAQFGTITRVSLPTNRDTGTPKGFGYVGFSSVDEAKEAMSNLKGTELAGRAIRLDYAQPRPEGDNNGGGGGFRGGRGGGGDRGGRGRGRGGFGDRGGGFGGRGGGRGRGRGGFGDRGGFGGRGGSTNRGGFGEYQGKKTSF